MKRFCMVALLVLGLTVVPSSSSPATRKRTRKQETASIWMKSKTKLSQEILLGLTEAISRSRKNAKSLDFVHFFESFFRRVTNIANKRLCFVANKELIRQASAKIFTCHARLQSANGKLCNATSLCTAKK